MVEFVSFRWRQAFSRNKELEAGEALGGVAITDAAQPRHEMVFPRSQRLDHEMCRAVFALQGSIVPDRHGVRGEGFKSHLAASAMRAADLGYADACGHLIRARP